MNKVFSRSITILIAGVLVFVTGCSSKNTGAVTSPSPVNSVKEVEKKSVTIKVANMQHTAVAALETKLGDYEKQTGIKVVFDNLPQEELLTKTDFALASNSDQYDVIMMDMMFTTKYAKAGWIKDITKDIQDNEAKIQKADLMEKFVDALSYDGKNYGLPFFGESSMLMYNKKMFKEAGIEKPPATMDELLEDAKKLTKNGKYGIALRGMAGEGMNIYIWSGFFNAFGGKWLKDGKPEINSPEAIKATQLYQTLVRDYGPPGGANFSWDQVQLSVQQGTTAMSIDATNFAPRLEDKTTSKVVGDMGYAPLPTGPNGSSSSIYTAGYVVAKGSKHQTEALDFIIWATSKDIQLQTALEGIRGDATRKSVWNDPKFKEKYKYEGWINVAEKSMAEANPDYRPRIQEWQRMGNRLGIAVSEVLSGKDVKASLDKAQTEIETYFKK